MKVMLIGVHYCESKYRPTKAVQKMLTSVGHELVSSPKEGVTVCLGRLMPFDKPKKPDVLLKAESLGLGLTDLDALMGVEKVQEKLEEQPKTNAADSEQTNAARGQKQVGGGKRAKRAQGVKSAAA